MEKRFKPPRVAEINLALSRLEKVVLDTLDFTQVVQKVVDSMLFELDYLKLGYRIVVLALIDKRKKVLKRVSISQTAKAELAIAGLPFTYDKLEIPLRAKKNYCIRVMNEGKPLATHCWPDILSPPLTIKQAAELQKKVGIKTSMVYPLLVRNKPTGMMIFSMVKSDKDVSRAEKELLLRFTDIVGLAVQNSQLYTSLEKTTKKLKKANVKLKELDKLKDEFVYVASHELRTPMTAIKSYLWLALNKTKGLESKLKKNLTQAYDSTERLINLVQNMLTVSRIEGKRLVLSVEEFDLCNLAKQVHDELKIKAEEKKIKFVCQPHKTTLRVRADKARITEVIQNLVGNALKFTPEKGKITLTLSKEGKFAQFAIVDNGPGIPKEQMPQLFQKFGRMEHAYRKRTESSGTGLGLYIAKQIIDLHQGKIWAESEVGKGSLFFFTLPVKK